MTFKTIADLEETKINQINDYLINNGMPSFTQDQLDFIKSIEKKDPIQILSACAVVRGFFAEIPEESFVGLDPDGFSLDQLVKNHRDNLDIDQLTPEAIEKSIEDFKSQAESSIIRHAIVLDTGKWAESYVVFLNKNYDPIHINYTNLMPIALEENDLSGIFA